MAAEYLQQQQQQQQQQQLGYVPVEPLQFPNLSLGAGQVQTDPVVGTRSGVAPPVHLLNGSSAARPSAWAPVNSNSQRFPQTSSVPQAGLSSTAFGFSQPSSSIPPQASSMYSFPPNMPSSASAATATATAAAAAAAAATAARAAGGALGPWPGAFHGNAAAAATTTTTAPEAASEPLASTTQGVYAPPSFAGKSEAQLDEWASYGEQLRLWVQRQVEEYISQNLPALVRAQFGSRQEVLEARQAALESDLKSKFTEMDLWAKQVEEKLMSWRGKIQDNMDEKLLVIEKHATVDDVLTLKARLETLATESATRSRLEDVIAQAESTTRQHLDDLLSKHRELDGRLEDLGRECISREDLEKLHIALRKEMRSEAASVTAAAFRDEAATVAALDQRLKSQISQRAADLRSPAGSRR